MHLYNIIYIPDLFFSVYGSLTVFPVKYLSLLNSNIYRRGYCYLLFLAY